MALFRCNKCGHLREVANDHIGKSAKCPQCQQVNPIHDTLVYIEKILERYFAQRKELIRLQQNETATDSLDIQVIDAPSGELFSLKDVDIHNTTELTNDQQYQPIITWFAAHRVTVQVNPKELDTTGFFDEVAIELGNHYETLREASEKIKRIQNKGYTNVNFQLAQKSQKHIQEIVNFCNQLYKFAFVAKCFYQKQEKILKLTLQTAPTIVQFFNGVWLEWFVFMKMFRLLQQKNIAFSGARSITVTLPNEDYYELDAFFLINGGIPLCIECKSGEFRQDLDKYSRLRKRLNIDKNHFLLCVAGLSDEQAQGLTSMYEVTLVNERSFISHVDQLLG
jgi:phage FluMu protein Com